MVFPDAYSFNTLGRYFDAWSVPPAIFPHALVVGAVGEDFTAVSIWLALVEMAFLNAARGVLVLAMPTTPSESLLLV